MVLSVEACSSDNRCRTVCCRRCNQAFDAASPLKGCQLAVVQATVISFQSCEEVPARAQLSALGLNESDASLD
jgi:hypothetical protein